MPTPAKQGFARHFEGWQVGALMIFIVASISAVMVPRSADPQSLPPADIGLELLARTRAQSARAREQAEARVLPNSARLLGARLRALGRAETARDERAIDHGRDMVFDAARQALHESPEAVIALRDMEAARFRQAYLELLTQGSKTDDLIELGGSILLQLEDNGWLTKPSEIDASTDILLEGFYKRRFARVLDDNQAELLPSEAEERVVLGFLLLHPPKPPPEGGNSGGDGTGPYLLRRIDELTKLEPSYPATYAKGIVLFRMGHFEASASAFDAFLQQGSDGPYRLRAVNYLKSAVEHTEGM